MHIACVVCIVVNLVDIFYSLFLGGTKFGLYACWLRQVYMNYLHACWQIYGGSWSKRKLVIPCPNLVKGSVRSVGNRNWEIEGTKQQICCLNIKEENWNHILRC